MLDSALTPTPQPMHADPSGPPASLPRRALLVFLDGVGIGSADPALNPVAAARLPVLEALLGGARPVREHLGPEGWIGGPLATLVPAGATLGVPGKPQSGTGQTALLAGFNAPAAYGRHFGPWVPTGLREALAARNLLSMAKAAGHTVAFANAYPLAAAHADPRIFRRPAAPPLAARAAGVLDRGLPELAEGRAVASSITREHWRARVGAELPDVAPAEAGRDLARIAAEAHVTLFAHYDTDVVGHDGDMAGAVAALERVDAFLGGLVEALPGDALLVVSSDHGNVEELSSSHTLNPVPVLAVGPGRDALAARVRTLADVSPALLSLLGIAPADADG